MADTDLPSTGSETKIQILLGGVPVALIDQIDTASVDQEVDTVEHKPLGTHTAYVDKVPKGWRIQLGFKTSTAGLDELVDAIDSARRNNVPTVVNVTITTHYRDGTSATYLYPDVKFDLGGISRRRGEADGASLTGRTGAGRIRL